MKVITLSVTALLITAHSFGQTKDTAKRVTATYTYELKAGAMKPENSKIDSVYKQSNYNTTDEAAFDALSKLPEFNQERKRIASLRKDTRLDVKLHIDYNENPYLDEVGSKDLSMIKIFEVRPGGENVILLTVLFDKDKKCIYSVEDHIRKTKKVQEAKTNN